MVKVQQTISFITDDGRRFDNREEARRHEAGLRISEWLDKHSVCCGGPWLPDDVLNVMTEDADELLKALAEYAGYRLTKASCPDRKKKGA